MSMGIASVETASRRILVVMLERSEASVYRDEILPSPTLRSGHAACCAMQRVPPLIKGIAQHTVSRIGGVGTRNSPLVEGYDTFRHFGKNEKETNNSYYNLNISPTLHGFPLRSTAGCRGASGISAPCSCRELRRHFG